MPNWVFTTPTSLTLRRSERFLKGSTRKASGLTRAAHDAPKPPYLGTSMRGQLGPGHVWDGAEADRYRAADARLKQGEASLSRAHRA